MNHVSHEPVADPVECLSAFPEAFAGFAEDYRQALTEVARQHGDENLVAEVLAASEPTVFSPEPLRILNARCDGAGNEVMPYMVAQQNTALAARKNQQPGHHFRSASIHLLGSAAAGFMTLTVGLRRPHMH